MLGQSNDTTMLFTAPCLLGLVVFSRWSPYPSHLVAHGVTVQSLFVPRIGSPPDETKRALQGWRAYVVSDGLSLARHRTFSFVVLPSFPLCPPPIPYFGDAGQGFLTKTTDRQDRQNKLIFVPTPTTPLPRDGGGEGGGEAARHPIYHVRLLAHL